MPSLITKQLVDQILARDAHGQQKYGVNLDRDDLTLVDWLQHMAEEMMDGAAYALTAKRETQALNTLQLMRHVEKAAANVLANVDGTSELRDGIEAGVHRMLHAIRLELGP